VKSAYGSPARLAEVSCAHLVNRSTRARYRGELFESRAQMPAHARIVQPARLYRGCIDEHERTDFAPLVAGDHSVLDERVPSGDQPDARRADVHPGARRKLEVFGDASVESEAQLGLLGIGEFQRVADAVVAFLVERC